MQGSEIIRERRATTSRLAAVGRDIEIDLLGLKRSIERHSRVTKILLKAIFRRGADAALARFAKPLQCSRRGVSDRVVQVVSRVSVPNRAWP